MAAALGVAALAGPGQALAAPAVINTPPVLPHSIIVFPQRDFVSTSGFTPGKDVVVDVLRNGHLLATSTPVTAGADGLAEVNHPGGGCWVGVTPDILPGDTVRATVVGSNVADQTTTADVTAEPAVIVGSDIVIHGTARDAAGNPLPIDQIEQRMVANKQAFDLSGRRTMRADATGTADGTLAYDAPGSIHWTATYKGVTAADQAMARGAETRILWLGRNPASTAESTIYETASDQALAAGFVGGPTAPCTAPAATTAIIRTDRTVVSAANVTTPLTIEGVATPDITNVSVHVGAGPLHDAVVNADGTWSGTIPAADLAGLPEGAFTLTASYVSNTGTAPPDEARTLTKDTVAPPAPGATPAAATYPSTQVATLSDAEPGARLFYTIDGSDPTTQSLPFTAPLTITSSQVIKAIAVDAAGNASGVASFPFVIAPPAPIATPAPIGTPAPIATTPTGGTTRTGGTAPTGGTKPTVVAAPARLRLGSLTVPSTVRAARLRLRGLTATMTLPARAIVVRIRVYRASRTGRRIGAPLAQVFRVPPRARTYRVTLRSRSLLARMRPGRYIVEVRAGTSRVDLGAAASRVVNITR